MATNNNGNSSKKKKTANLVITEAQAFVKAAKERRQHHHHSSSLLPPQLQILEDHEGPALQQLLESYDTFLFDCDGVLWRGAELLPGSDRTLALLRARGKHVFFVTNNSSKSRAQYMDKFKKLQIPVSLEELVPSSWAAAEYLNARHPEVKKAFVIGSQGLVDELALVGIESVCGADPRYATKIFASEGEFLAAEADPEVGAVVCGWDLTFNYAKLCLASLHLQKNSDVVFVATNKDAFDKLADRNVPGNGCAVAALEQSVGRAAITVGKPSPWLVERLVSKHKLDPKRTLMVGDRLDTDIQLGVVGGTGSMLVGTGCTSTVETLEEWVRAEGADALPTYLLSHVGALSK